MTPDEFIDEFQTLLAGASLDRPGAKVELSPAVEAVSFDLLCVEPAARGAKIARHVLELLLRLSDATGMTILVIPACVYPGDGALTDDQLERWYRDHGFKHAGTPDTPRLMRRVPKRK
jgi:GNAT superfamily N-acetyltransferase